MPTHRLLDSHEADLLLNLSVSAEAAWDVVVATVDEDFARIVTESFDTDNDVKVQHLCTGGDVLVQSTRLKPDLLVLDERLNDIAAPVIARSLRRYDEFTEMRILATGRGETTPIVFRGMVDDWYDTDDSDTTLLVRKIRWLLDTPIESASPGEVCQRRWPRTRVNIAAAVELFNDHDCSPVLRGGAVISDISRNGALLTSMILDGDLEPDIQYRARLKVDHPPLEGLDTDSLVVRITSQDTAGITFINMPTDDRHRITDLCDE